MAHHSRKIRQSLHNPGETSERTCPRCKGTLLDLLPNSSRAMAILWQTGCRQRRRRIGECQSVHAGIGSNKLLPSFDKSLYVSSDSKGRHCSDGSHAIATAVGYKYHRSSGYDVLHHRRSSYLNSIRITNRQLQIGHWIRRCKYYLLDNCILPRRE